VGISSVGISSVCMHLVCGHLVCVYTSRLCVHISSVCMHLTHNGLDDKGTVELDTAAKRHVPFQYQTTPCCHGELCSLLRTLVAVCCRVLQCIAVCCSVSQCVAVCCSVLHGSGVRKDCGMVSSGASSSHAPTHVLRCVAV